MKTSKHWPMTSLEDVAEIQTGLSKSAARQGKFVQLPYLRVANVQDGHFDLTEIKEIDVPADMVDRFRVRTGDVLLTEGGDFDKLGRGAVWQGQIKDCVHQNHIFVVRPHPHKLDARFFALQTQGPRGRAYFQSCSKQSTNLASINSTQLRQFPAAVPPLPEQYKISDILTTWDTALEKLDALIAAKERRKKALMQQLLSGKRRYPGQIAVKFVKLSEVAKEKSIRNVNAFDRSRLFAVTKAEGMVPMRERVQGVTVNRCKIVEYGWFAYNPMRLNIGSIARWEGSAPVMVSGDYVVFCTYEERLLSTYLHYIRQSIPWAQFVGSSGNGGVRIRIWFDDLGRFRFPLPSLAEQQSTVTILGAADDELRLLQAKRNMVAQQKYGLMQRLLTGKVRVR